MKRICTLLLSAAIMIFSAIPLGITASAETYIGSLLDYADCFTNDQEALIRDMLAHTAQTAGCNVGLVTADDLEGKSAMGYTEDILDSMFVTDSDSIVLLLNNDFDNEDHYDWISFTGAAADRYNDELGALYDSIYSQMETDGYIGAVIGYCNYLGLNRSDINDELGQTENDLSTEKYKVVLNDMDDMLSDSNETDLTNYMSSVAKNIRCHIGVVITDDLKGMSDEEYATNFANESFSYGSDLVVLLLNNDRSNDNYTDWIYTYGRGTDLFDPAIDGIFDAVYNGMGDYQENIADYDYFTGIINFCYALDDIYKNSEDSYYYNSDNNYYYDDSKTNDQSAATIKSYKVILSDMDDMLSASDEADLTERMRTTAQNIKCHVGIVITDDLEGMSDEEYAINFAKESFSYGSDLVVLLLNNDRSNDDYTDWIYTYGRGTDLFDPAIDGIFDTVYDGLGDYQENIADYDYHSGIINFCNALEDVSENGQNSYYYHSEDDYYDDGEDSIIVALGVPVIMAGIITAITVGCTASGYSKKKPISARHYMDASRTRFLNRRDVYLRETTTSVKISSSSSGGGGSRGGGGGRSRSGGGGGGGRRR